MDEGEEKRLASQILEEQAKAKALMPESIESFS
jgi:hypothetical protein